MELYLNKSHYHAPRVLNWPDSASWHLTDYIWLISIELDCTKCQSLQEDSLTLLSILYDSTSKFWRLGLLEWGIEYIPDPSSLQQTFHSVLMFFLPFFLFSFFPSQDSCLFCLLPTCIHCTNLVQCPHCPPQVNLIIFTS